MWPLAEPVSTASRSGTFTIVSSGLQNGPGYHPLLPNNLPPPEVKRISAALIEMEKKAVAEFEKRASKNLDGVIVMPRVEISNVTYQSFLSQNGNKLGMELSYDLRFSVDGDYAHSLQMFPFYEDDNIRGFVEMNVYSEQISPRPEPPSYATPDIHADLNTLVIDGSEAWYKGGVRYHFTVKLVPSFVHWNTNYK